MHLGAKRIRGSETMTKLRNKQHPYVPSPVPRIQIRLSWGGTYFPTEKRQANHKSTLQID